MKISVIFTTYNAPRWLEKVLTGFFCQTERDFEIIVADDGSGAETQMVIDRFAALGTLPVRHVWQADDGFRKCRILNKAIVAAQGDYIIMTDGDCIPRADFVAVHRRYAEPGYYLSGGYFKLPMETSEAIGGVEIRNGKAFDVPWLIAHGLKKTHKTTKLTATPFTARLLNALTPTRRTWNGHNASGWKRDMLAANGFDERMRYGGEDCEFGERLVNAGIKAKQIRYSAVCVHLDHARGYVNEEDKARNNQIRAETRRTKRTVTDFGIRQAGAK